MKRKNHVREILRTTDGNLYGKPYIKKPRNVVVVYQRKDKCLIVSKIFDAGSHNGRREGLRLDPNRRNGLKKRSVVEYRVHAGFKKPDSTYQPFLAEDFTYTGHRIGILDLLKIRKALRGNPKTKDIIDRWQRHFK